MYIVNPPASIIAAYRDILYYGSMSNFDFFSRTVLTSIVVLVLGYAFFVRLSRNFSERL